MAFLVPILGAALGIGCGSLFLIAKRRESMAWGLGSIIVSFLVICAGIFAVRALLPDMIVATVVIMVLAFLGTSVVAVLLKRNRS